MNLLISGGAGYIGSHFVKYAQSFDHEVTVLDNFSTGHHWSIANCEILEVDLLDKEKLAVLLKNRHFDGVIHFAGKSLVGESFCRPDFYYENNFTGTANLVAEMFKNDIDNLVFSSSAAIFGMPSSDRISENHIKKPINPYGKSKLMVEEMLIDICNSYDFNATCFRYFNAAGAHVSGSIGEAHNPETHLIPIILKSIIHKKDGLKIFGNDYETKDGTCIRDYVHVTDLAQAHLAAFDHMQQSKGFSAFNLGNGNGFSVLDIIDSCSKITNTSIDYKFADRREGDPPMLVADSSKAKNLLSWNIKFSELDDIILSAYQWHSKEKIS